LIVHGAEMWNPKNWWWYRWFLKRTNHIITPSLFTQNTITHGIGRGYQLAWTHIPPALRNAPTKNLQDLEKEDARKVLLSVARLEPDYFLTTQQVTSRSKGIDRVIKALPLVLQTVPMTHYLVVGDGSDRPRLESLVKELGLETHCTFTGYVSEEIKALHYQSADAFVLASTGEGFGIVYLEALACGLSVVGSALDGSCGPLLNGKLGTLVDPENREELATAIINALTVGKKTPPKELEQFSFEKFCERVTLMVRSIIHS
jgi:glycosyltransferase involved in cell wall biosynthesis